MNIAGDALTLVNSPTLVIEKTNTTYAAAIDSIRASGNGKLSQEQSHTIIDKLIVDQEIKNIIL